MKRQGLWRILPLLLLFSSSLGACGVVNPDLFRPPAPAPTQVLPTVDLAPFLEEETSGRISDLPLANVTFRVVIPENTPAGEPIQIHLLDEVTGLALNQQRIPMQPEDERVHVVTIPLPAGSMIKYRYARLGTVTALEHRSDDRPVRYRLLRVDGPGVVEDVITRWNDTVYQGPTGRIDGRITDAANGQPIPNLMVLAGGAQAITDWDGRYLIEGLPPGIHNLVAYAMDGSYATFQQGATVAEGATTPASFSIPATALVPVRFRAQVPEDTVPGVPLRLAGNLYQFGNTFADLSAGISVPASRMPVLAFRDIGRYELEMSLPAGTYLRYKYSLGDGFWNAERSTAGAFVVREIVIPPEGITLEDQVESWSSPGKGSILFDVNIPAGTPAGDFVSIQFHPFGWTEPIPMWRLSESRWVYQLASPLDFLDTLDYRYCRNDQCGSADDAATPDFPAAGRSAQPGASSQTLSDQVDSWEWMAAFRGAIPPTAANASRRAESFMAGIEWLPSYHPSWMPLFARSAAGILDTAANWSVLTPTWTFTRESPPVLELVTGRDLLWPELATLIQESRSQGLRVGLFPTPSMPIAGPPGPGSYHDLWWQAAPRDFVWWVMWFEEYESFLQHHASVARQFEAEMLILGGEWLSPALPDGLLADGSQSGVPADAEERWRQIIAELRGLYDGRIAWALTYPQDLQRPPAFLDSVDLIYVLWSAPLGSQSAIPVSEIQAAAERILDREVILLEQRFEQPMVLAVSYPSAGGAIQACVPAPGGSCRPFDALSPPNPDLPAVSQNLNVQLKVYQALLNAVNERDWIDGFVSRGYYPPAALRDKSTSIHGKPAQELLANWFQVWVGSE